ncbi:uncharacterized protein SCHCODRAFT_02605466 [Schizophyllum commune H4-8]|uniref:uncharacterized protein n=1 Tax=Schizophyllum commune (strain H4-8 / FGSC 9210) TaxID=578458 RepID=UPI00215FEB66|nr:uncharacterized protein SCHCODRAFT_02605466 [Schizophyllum commune H4-8]KAI5899554.1 hypothetical protein SCHCODRAFT_02605466 [Schizophyllum commune H4-8]
MAPWQTSTPPRRQRARPLYKKSPLSTRRYAPASDRPRGQRLAPLFEESPSPPRRPRKSSAHYRSALDETLFGDGDASDDDIPRLFQWEDEKTLVSDLMHHSTARHDPNDARYAETLEQLHQLFRDQDYALVDDMAKALFPAVDTVKRCHAHAKEEIDETFARGMTEFNDACKSVEAVTVEDLKLLRKSHDETKARLASLFEQLDAAYAKRKQLWKDFKQDFNVILGAAEDQLKTLPAQFERTCAALDKESKKLSKTDGQAEKLTALLKKL